MRSNTVLRDRRMLLDVSLIHRKKVILFVGETNILTDKAIGFLNEAIAFQRNSYFEREQ